MSNATIERLERINTVYVQTIREQDARIASLEAQLAAAQERERVTLTRIREMYDLPNSDQAILRQVMRAIDAALAAASEKGGAE